jgi:GntR family transcriptional repressor for pyruvate dehydrogenase complex
MIIIPILGTPKREAQMRVNDAVFEAVDVNGVADAVVWQVERLIVSAVLRSGQKLPAERDLAERLGVSRQKLREALEALETRGLVVARHGDGTYVAALTGAALAPAMVDLFARHPQAFGDYLEFRRETEAFAAHLAALRATESDHARLEGIVARMEAAHADRDPAEEARIDVALHAAIVDAAHNAMLAHVMASVYDLMARGVFYNRGFLYTHQGGRDRLLEQHRAIAAAILRRDPDAASAAAEAHIDHVRASFRTATAVADRERLARKRLILSENEAARRTARTASAD